MKTLKQIFASTLILFSISAHAGRETGNGGDHVRASFIQMGTEIVSFLTHDEAGRLIVRKFELNLAELRSTLDPRKIFVVPGPLTDNGGSLVDAQGVRGMIRLDRDRWSQMISSGNDIFYLVFHEMLRSIGVDDDSYKISFFINPFRQGQKSMDQLAASNNEQRCDVDYLAQILYGKVAEAEQSGNLLPHQSVSLGAAIFATTRLQPDCEKRKLGLRFIESTFQDLKALNKVKLQK